MLLVGRLVYEKGFHLALDALPGLIRRVGKVRFLIAGSGTAEAELKEQAARLGLMEHGTFIGWTGDDVLHSLYRIADLCLVPSIYEPFGLVALEAMARGCPTIVADTGGLREVVPRGRRVGLRFRASSVRSLERMAQDLLTDDALRERLVAEASEHVLRFDWAEVARETVGVYERLVTARRRAARRPRSAPAPSTGAPRRARPPRPRPRSRPGRATACGPSTAPAPTTTGARPHGLLAHRASRRRPTSGRRPSSAAQSPITAPRADLHAARARRRPRARRAARPRPSADLAADGVDPALRAEHDARAEHHARPRATCTRAPARDPDVTRHAQPTARTRPQQHELRPCSMRRYVPRTARR